MAKVAEEAKASPDARSPFMAEKPSVRRGRKRGAEPP
jgi:hypothetical protein